jgi:hypothetical protein
MPQTVAGPLSVLLIYSPKKNESQYILQMYPGFWSCVIVGINHPVHPVQVFANTGPLTMLSFQFPTTSAHLGATIHAVDASLQIRNPPAPLGREPNGAAVSKDVMIHAVKSVIVSEVPIPTN